MVNVKMGNGKPVAVEVQWVRTLTYSYETYQSILNHMTAFGNAILKRCYDRAVLAGTDIDVVLMNWMIFNQRFSDLSPNFEKRVLLVRDYAVMQNLMEIDTSIPADTELRTEYFRLPGWEIELDESGLAFFEKLLSDEFLEMDRLIGDATKYLSKKTRTGMHYQPVQPDDFDDIDDYVDR